MRRRISIRGCVRPSVRQSVGPSVGRSVPSYFQRWKARILGASCAVYPALFCIIFQTHNIEIVQIKQELRRYSMVIRNVFSYQCFAPTYGIESWWCHFLTLDRAFCRIAVWNVTFNSTDGCDFNFEKLSNVNNGKRISWRMKNVFTFIRMKQTNERKIPNRFKNWDR